MLCLVAKFMVCLCLGGTAFYALLLCPSLSPPLSACGGVNLLFVMQLSKHSAVGKWKRKRIRQQRTDAHGVNKYASTHSFWFQEIIKEGRVAGRWNDEKHRCVERGTVDFTTKSTTVCSPPPRRRLSNKWCTNCRSTAESTPMSTHTCGEGLVNGSKDGSFSRLSGLCQFLKTRLLPEHEIIVEVRFLTTAMAQKNQ